MLTDIFGVSANKIQILVEKCYKSPTVPNKRTQVKDPTGRVKVQKSLSYSNVHTDKHFLYTKIRYLVSK